MYGYTPFNQYHGSLFRQQIINDGFQQRVLSKDFRTDRALNGCLDLGLASDVVSEVESG